MLLIQRRVWSAQATSVDTTFDSVNSELAHSLSYVLTFAGSSFTGTVDIQGREDIADAWANIGYRTIDAGGGIGSLVTDAIRFVASSDRTRYLIPIAPAQVRLSLALSGGTVSAWVRGSGVPILPSTDSGDVNYFRLSTEPFPANPYADPDTVVKVGATLLEYDTGNFFRYAGAQRGWVRQISESVESLLEQILRELSLLRKGQELFVFEDEIA